MKHSLKVTLFLVALFIAAQLAGLVIMSYNIHPKQEVVGGKQTVTISYTTDQSFPRPVVDKTTSFAYIMAAVLIGTGLLLLLIKFRKIKLWKAWFFLSVAVSCAIAFRVFMAMWIALLLGIVLAVLKVYKPNIITHNLSEVFIYSGIAVLFVPLMNIFSAVALLVLISIYDIIAVWQSKHMVTLANFQTKQKLFAGLFIPYKTNEFKVEGPKPAEKKEEKKASKEAGSKGEGIKNAILGGGDIAFPLIFTGTVMETLVTVNMASKSIALLESLIVVACAAAAILALFYKAEKDKFYPAMPFITIGCFVGYIIILLL